MTLMQKVKSNHKEVAKRGGPANIAFRPPKCGIRHAKIVFWLKKPYFPSKMCYNIKMWAKNPLFLAKKCIFRNKRMEMAQITTHRHRQVLAPQYLGKPRFFAVTPPPPTERIYISYIYITTQKLPKNLKIRSKTPFPEAPKPQNEPKNTLLQMEKPRNSFKNTLLEAICKQNGRQDIIDAMRDGLANIFKFIFKSKEEKPMQTFQDPRWKAYIKKCQDRVSQDNKELGINSIFVPPTQICPSPKYLIIAMEPLMTPGTEEKLGQWLKGGYRGFVHFTIDYCAYKYLCGGKYEYQFVDYCKGAMSIANAGKDRAKRYSNWLPLLEEEWDLLGSPYVITVGKGLYDTLMSLDFKPDGYILHYSPQAAGHRQKEYEHFKLSLPGKAAKAEMRKVITELLELQGYKQSFWQNIWGKAMESDIEKESLHALYKHNFEDFKKNKEISHINPTPERR